MGQSIDAFIAKWAAAGPAERANKVLDEVGEATIGHIALRY